MPGLPLDQNGSIAAVDAPPVEQPKAPAIPKSSMSQVATNMGMAQTPGASGASPEDQQELTLLDKIKQIEERRKQRQATLQSKLGPDGLRSYLPNGGKAKPSDLLADALFNTAQLNLRNPTFGVLKGQDFKPVQQQRMEEALKLHQSDIQNLTQQEVMDRDESTTAMAQLNQQRLHKQQQDKVTQYEATNAIKEKDLSQKAAKDEANFGLKWAMLQPDQDSKAAKTALDKARTNYITAQTNGTLDPKTAIQAYLRDFYDPADPNAQKKLIAFENALNPKEPKSTTMLVPSQDGSSFTVVNATAGSQVPAGAMTPAGASSMYSTPLQAKMMVWNARTVSELADETEQLLAKAEKSLGAPLRSRWEHFMVNKVGLPGVEYVEFGQAIDLLKTKLMQMHTGNRSSDAQLEHFSAWLDEGKADPDNLRAAMRTIKRYAERVASEKVQVPGRENSKPASFAPPPVGKPKKNVVPGETHNGKKVAKVEIIP